MEEGLLCMNGKCVSSSSPSSSSSISVQWKKGWPLRSPAFGFATLCHNCGSAYEQLSFCEMFHSEESGWRECSSCGKRLHCGCIASSSFLDLLDTGGVMCKSCSGNSSKLPSTTSEEKQKACGISTDYGMNLDFEKLLPTKSGEDDENDSRNVDKNSNKQENGPTGSGEIRFNLLSSFSNSSTCPSNDYESLQEKRGAKSVHTSSVPTDLCISLSASSNLHTFSGVNAEESQLSIGMSSFQQGISRPRHLLPRLPNSILATAGLQTNSSSISQLRIARPPVEGRVKNQLLPRYWPRITDQELQQISGESNSTIVPLFEKVLSASDAGRIGRLVLPKACAEAYFPQISQPEGLPLRIQDVRGKEWVFQFRFWPNNNSRMYVLEGVTPCIQSMQLQAGDTVTFSRMDPEGKLLMGFRKASKHNSTQKDTHYNFQSEPLLVNAENLPIMGGYSGFLHSLKGSRGSYSGNASKLGDNPVPQSMLGSDRKRRNIGPKSKRLVIDGHDSMELTLSWEEVQDMLRPPPSVEPSTLSVEDHEFEEFEEPPVFGKKSIFTVRLSGEQEQWTQCDSCFKWRKVPIDMLLPPKWTCQDNINDRARCSCSAPDELSSRELDNLLKMNNDFTKLRFPASFKPALRHESLDHEEIHTNAAPVVSDQGASSVATTTKHPRHRPGCSCIVCIQPPSGKGKHKPTCTCNVCMTVKRRFKTLMMRKKKRQSDREAEIAQRNETVPPAAAKEDTEVDNPKGSESEVLLRCQSECRAQENAETFEGGLLDLNFCPPGRENTAMSRVSMLSLLQEASLPLEIYLRQNGLTSLVSEQQAASPHGENTPIDQAREEDGTYTAVVQEHEEDSDEFSEKDQRENDHS